MKVYEFGPFRLDPGERQLRRGGTPLPLTPKAFDTLAVLVGSPGRAVGKDELMDRVWAGTNVADATLAQNIFALRKALGGAHWIETVPKFGYRFVPAVREVPEPPARVVLAVLPFVDLSSGGDRAYFADGLAGEMITQLGRLNPERLRVIARSSSMRYRDTPKTAREIGRELGVSFVFEGAVRVAGARVRVDVQLIETAGQTQVWAESYDRAFEDILLLQRDLSHAVAREIKVALMPQVAPGRSAVSREAHEAYLKGRYFWNKRTEESMRKGIALFEEAIARDPAYAPAYDGLSDSYVMLACRGVLPARETFEKARAAAETALRLDGTLGEAHATRAHVRLHELDWDGLDEEFQRALALNPSHTFTYYWYGEYLMAVGRTDEAVAMVARAREMDPLSGAVSSSLAMILYLARRYEESMACLRAFLELEADHFLVHLRMGLVSMQMGAHQQAIEEMHRAVTLSGRATEALAGLAQAYAAAGLRREMHDLIAELQAEALRRYVAPYNMAKVHAAAADADAAFACLEAAFEERYPDLIELGSEPLFDAIRADPRYGALLRRVGIA